MSPTEEKAPTEEEIRENLRTIGLARLARSADLPKHLPTISHSIYTGFYCGSYGDRPLMDDIPYHHWYHRMYLILARTKFDNIVYCDEYVEEFHLISKWHYKYMVEEGQMIAKSARGVLRQEQVEKYVDVVEKAIGYMDTVRGREWSKELDDEMEREVLLAYLLKAMEIGKRWPRRIAALGLGRLTLESM